MVIYIPCSKCGEKFYAGSLKRFLCDTCLEKHKKEYKRNYFQKHKDKYTQYQRDYRERHREEYNRKARIYQRERYHKLKKLKESC